MMGNSQSISLKQLQELRDTLRRLQVENEDYRTQIEKHKNSTVRASTNDGLKEEMSSLESKVVQLEYDLGMKDTEIKIVSAQASDLKTENSELKDKVKWFREN